MSDPTPSRDTPAETPKPAYAVDLSTGAARGTRPRRSTPKGFVPVVQQTINLSTKKQPKATPEARVETPAHGASAGPSPRGGAAGGTGRGAQPKGGSGRNDAPRGGGRDAPRAEPSGGGTSLADLLDEATLARLRGAA